MPRKTSQRSAAIAETKNEGGAPRRSGRAATKQETTSSKEASRSRRSSTAAQTAASVADSRTPRAKGGSRRESTSPSDNRSRTGGETPATRAKSSRRSTGRINYQESDGEESNTKFDENFESGEDVEDSESDEKSKTTRGRSRSTKAVAKSTEKSKGTSRSRRGRPGKKKEDEEEEEENETFDVSDDSNEPQEVPVKKGRAAKEKEPAKPARNRRQKAEVTEIKSKAATEEKSRSTRRSGRVSTNKEESPKKRPTRGVQAKRYAEDDDDEIEEISDSKGDDDDVVEMKETEGRKRKRGASPEEANKRLKDADDEPDKEQAKETEEKDVTEEGKESVEEKKPTEEPMEVDASYSAEIPETEMKQEEEVKEKSTDLKVEEKVDQADEESVEEKVEHECTEEKMEQEETASEPKEEKQDAAEKQDNIKSSNKDETIQSSDSEKKIKTSVPEVPDVKETDKEKSIDTPVIEEKINHPKVEEPKVPGPISQPAEQKSEKDILPPPPQPPIVSEPTLEKSADKKPEPTLDATMKANNEIPKSENVPVEEKKIPSVEVTTLPSVTLVPATPPKETDSALNGAEQSTTTQNSTNDVVNVSTPNVNLEHSENNTPKANGAHNDVQHTNSPHKDQYYLVPGRKYVINSKLNENVRQSVKNSMFGFVSFNLGTPDSDAYLQKDKLLNELSKLDAHVICLQQVAKPFYNAVLEPSLDALGFKSIFSQPQDSLKGMATFYKSSLFRLSGKSDISLRELVEKEIEASPLDAEQKNAVKSHIRRCGSVLFTHFSTVIGTQTVTVANVQIPRSDFSSHALQISCLAQEVIRINGGTNKPLLLGGEFNIAENDASYQLLRDGYLSNEMIEELQQRKDVVLPDNKHDSLVNLLWKSFQHPSSNLCSCYHSVLDHEFIIPELKTASPDLLWFSSDSLHTVGVLDVVSDKTGDHHLSLKADIAFSI